LTLKFGKDFVDVGVVQDDIVLGQVNAARGGFAESDLPLTQIVHELSAPVVVVRRDRQQRSACRETFVESSSEPAAACADKVTKCVRKVELGDGLLIQLPARNRCVYCHLRAADALLRTRRHEVDKVATFLEVEDVREFDPCEWARM
jgi:hypothetical protein